MSEEDYKTQLLVDKHKAFIKALDTVCIFLEQILLFKLEYTLFFLLVLSKCIFMQKKDDYQYWVTEHLRMNVCTLFSLFIYLKKLLLLLFILFLFTN